MEHLRLVNQNQLAEETAGTAAAHAGHLTTEAVKEMFEADTLARLDSASGRHCSIVSTQEKVASWRERDTKIVMSAGVFDALHLNHMLALHHFRYLGAAAVLDSMEAESPNRESIAAVAASDMVRLVISSDTDARVSETKGRKAEKGASPKPLLSWQTRSLMLAKQYISSPKTNKAHSLIDLIVRHGSDTCSGQRCPHDDNVTIAEVIQPDLLVITGGSPTTIEAAKRSSIPDENILVFEETDLAYYDSLLEADVSTSALIKRARS